MGEAIVKPLIGVELLEKIGLDLDAGIDPRVDDGGIVLPGRFTHRPVEPGVKGEANGKQTPRGPTAGQGQRAAGGSWSTGGPSSGGPWTSCPTPSVFSELGLTGEQACILEGVGRAYPQMQIRTTPDLLWLIFLITPIRGLDDSALLVSACPRTGMNTLISWAWWWPVLTWIGPRHTNYNPIGSICSFEPNDDTRHHIKSLTTLLDLQVVWIVRHLFMRWFGRWPGRQAIHTSWERLIEQRPGELCGGCESGLKYEGCCLTTDRAVDAVDRLFLFVRWLNRDFEKWSLERYHHFINQATWIPDRRPSRALTEFVCGYRKDPPSWNQLTYI